MMAPLVRCCSSVAQEHATDMFLITLIKSPAVALLHDFRGEGLPNFNLIAEFKFKNYRPAPPGIAATAHQPAIFNKLSMPWLLHTLVQQRCNSALGN
jgi:hypothetical protein